METRKRDISATEEMSTSDIVNIVKAFFSVAHLCLHQHCFNMKLEVKGETSSRREICTSLGYDRLLVQALFKFVNHG